MKPISEFYPHQRMRDGHLNRCKSCVRARVSEHRARNVDKIRAYDRERAKLPERKARFSRWLHGHWERFPKVRAAQIAVGNALRDRRLCRGPCEICGAVTVHGHHDDYDKPLAVRWLCVVHHAAWHIANGPGGNSDY